MRKRSLISLYSACILTFVFLFSSCKGQEKNNDLLNQAVAELEDNPQKAKELLEAIPNTKSMSEAQFMQYQLAYIESKYRTYDDIRQDSFIVQVRNYYDRHNDAKKGASADFYTASYYYENKQYGKALESYLMADHKAISSQNLKLAGKSQHSVGELFYHQNLLDSALFHFQKAYMYYQEITDSDLLQSHLFQSIGTLHYVKKDYRKAINSYRKGLQLADKQNNKDRIASFTQNIGASYFEMGELSQSKEYLYKALPITTNKADSVRLYLNLSRVYAKTNQLDSVSHYSALIEKNIAEVTYKPTLKLIYASLAKYNAKIGKNDAAMYYMELRGQINEEILLEQNTKQILEANAKFALALREKAHAQQKLWMGAVGCFLLLVLVIVVLVFPYKRQQLKLKLLRKQEKQLRLENDLLHQQSVNLEATLNTYDDILKSRKEILDDITFENIEKKNIDALFDKIRQNTNDLFAEWSKSSLKDHVYYKKIMLSLSSEELRIMHLLYLEYPHEIIAEMLGFGYNEENMSYRIKTIRKKLLNTGMKSEEVDSIFTIEDCNSKNETP